MKFRLKHQFQIESARHLPNLPEGHPCRRLHGHSFKIALAFVTELDPHIGWGLDYHEIQTRMGPVLKELDHRLLNEIPGLENPTSEYLAVWIYQRVLKIFPQLECVSVMETPDTECIYPVL